MKLINLNGLNDDEKCWRIEKYSGQNVFVWDEVKSLEDSHGMGNSPQRYIGGELVLSGKTYSFYKLKRERGKERFYFLTLNEILVLD